VWYAGWHEHEVALGHLLRFTTLDRLATPVVTVLGPFNQLSASDERGGAVDHVEELRVLFMNGRRLRRRRRSEPMLDVHVERTHFENRDGRQRVLRQLGDGGCHVR